MSHERAAKKADDDGLEPGGQLLVRLVGQAVLEGGRSMDPARLASMTKRLACTALQSGVGEVMGLLASLDRLLRSASPCFLPGACIQVQTLHQQVVNCC